MCCKRRLTQSSVAASRVIQAATLNGHIGLVQASWHQADAEAGERELGARFTDGLVHQNIRAVVQQNVVALPVAARGRPADSQ